MGLHEDIWMRESGSTFKYGVTFDGWRTGSDTRWHGFGDFVTEKGLNRSIDEFGKRQSTAKDDTVLVADYWIEMLKRGIVTEQDYYQYASDTYGKESSSAQKSSRTSIFKSCAGICV
jgi:hemerythrin-like domain-containing protein